MAAVKKVLLVLIAHGASLNKPNDGSSLYEAASRELVSADFSRFLIEQGYKPRCLGSEFSVFHDEVGLAMLHAYQHNMRIYPGDPLQPGMAPLSAELEAPVLEVMALYHELGYDFSRPCPYVDYPDNRTLLHRAINFRAHGVIEALIRYGARLRADDNFNYNLLDIAASNHDHIAYGLLADAGAPEPGNPSYASREEFAFTKDRYLTHKLASEASSRMALGSGNRQSGRRL